jgi:hypothetical protein
MRHVRTTSLKSGQGPQSREQVPHVSPPRSSTPSHLPFPHDQHPFWHWYVCITRDAHATAQVLVHSAVGAVVLGALMME